jgi:hypothetical protein
MNNKDFGLLKAIVFDVAKALQSYEYNYQVPNENQVLLDSQSWQDIADELKRASKIAQDNANEMAMRNE